MSSIWFILFTIIQHHLLYGFVYLNFFIQNAYADKNVFKKKGLQIMFNGSSWDRKSQLSGILPEPLNPRGPLPCELKYCETKLQNL